jgi:surface polysaccharide O-acyltransferase-like enzyme
MKTESRLLWVAAARGIAMLMVVLVHTIDWAAQSGAESNALAFVYEVCGTVMLPLFFTLSGVLGVRALNQSWPVLFRTRIAPLLWAFILWQPVVFMYKFAAGQLLPEQNDTSLSAHLFRLLASPVRPSGELWFIWALAIFFVVSKLTVGLSRWLQLGLAAVLCASWMSFVKVSFGDELTRLLGPGLNGLPTYYFFFLSGVMFGPLLMKRCHSVSRLGASLISAVWLALVTAAILTDAGSYPLVPFILRIAGVMGGIAFAIALSNLSLLRHVGRASMNVYLLHTTVIVFVVIVTHRLGWITTPWPAPFVLSLFALATTAGLVFYSITSRGKLSWTVQLPRRLKERLGAETLRSGRPN